MKDLLNYRNIWNISLPIILSGVAQNIVNVTDTAFLGRVGLVELGAAGNAGIFYFVIMVIGLGFSVGLQIIIGRRNGEENFNQIGALIKNSIWFVIPVSILLVFFVRFLSPTFLELVTTSEHILVASNKYLAIRSIGIPLAFINFIFIAFYTGITQTRVLIYATFIQAISNVILDYLFIFGFGQIEPMGIEGAALASALSDLVALLFFIIFTHNTVDYNKYGISKKVNFQTRSLLKILKVSVPIMIQNL